jgi:hypothetical protein
MEFERCGPTLRFESWCFGLEKIGLGGPEPDPRFRERPILVCHLANLHLENAGLGLGFENWRFGFEKIGLGGLGFENWRFGFEKIGLGGPEPDPRFRERPILVCHLANLHLENAGLGLGFESWRVDLEKIGLGGLGFEKGAIEHG